MNERQIYAVLTGDIVGSSRYSAEERKRILDVLKSALVDIDHHWKGIIKAPFEIHRGDAFQGILNQPEMSLHVAIWIRSRLRQLDSGSKRKRARSLDADARVAIGIGTVDSAAIVAEGQGEAFWHSGRTLERMEGEKRLLVKTPWPDVNDELEAEAGLLEAIMLRWTPRHAEVIGSLIPDLKRRQKDVADELGISQSAVAQRARQARWRAVQRLCLRFTRIIKMKLDPAGKEQGSRGDPDG